MIHAKLIIGGTPQKRLDKAEDIIKKALCLDSFKPHPDLFLIEGANSISIVQIRELKRGLSLKPYSAPVKAALITEAEKLTLPAQNAFLKTLEEPSINSLIILCCPNSNSLLPTVLSRCQIIQLPSEIEFEISKEDLSETKKLLDSILKGSVGSRLKATSQYFRSRDEAIIIIESLILVIRQLMLEKPSVNFTRNLHAAIETLKILQANVNPNLAVGNFFLDLK